MARTKLSSSDRTPLYEQLAADLRCTTRGGEFDTDQHIPSKAAIAADYDVSLRTVDTAVGLLKADGTWPPRQASACSLSRLSSGPAAS